MKPGILVISHGSRETEWVRLVDDTVAAVAASRTCADRGPGGSAVPVVSAFLELVEGRLIQDGIDTLTAGGVEELYVLPLFVSSGSTHADDIAQAFGLAPASPGRPGELAPFRLPAGVHVHMGQPIDDAGEVAGVSDAAKAGDGTAIGRGAEAGVAGGGVVHGRDTVEAGVGDSMVHGHSPAAGVECDGVVYGRVGADRDADADDSGSGGIASLLLSNIASLSSVPARERLLLIAHGSGEPVFHERWRVGMTRFAERLRALGGFAGADIAMLLPDQAAGKLTELRQRYPDDAIIVVPLFLSEGYFTRTVIPKRLAGLAYRYNGRALLPSPLVAEWMERQIRNWLTAMNPAGG